MSDTEILNEVWSALVESVKLQSHYAKLLNDYDEGERMVFDSPRSWIERLRKCREFKTCPPIEDYKPQG
jgi:hypothetical protein